MISLREIIGNIKKGQSALNVRAILNNLEKTYMSLQSSISIIGCDTEGESSCTVYMTMPSASTQGAIYDVVIWVNTQTKMKMETPLKVFTNSPSFAYNFAYVFHRKGSLLFPEKYPEEFRNMPPKVRNPYNSAGFDKHVFSGIRYISDYKLPRIVGQFGGTVPNVKSFQEKMREIGGIRAELERERSRLGR